MGGQREGEELRSIMQSRWEGREAGDRGEPRPARSSGRSPARPSSLEPSPARPVAPLRHRDDRYDYTVHVEACREGHTHTRQGTDGLVAHGCIVFLPFCRKCVHVCWHACVLGRTMARPCLHARCRGMSNGSEGGIVAPGGSVANIFGKCCGTTQATQPCK